MHQTVHASGDHAQVTQAGRDVNNNSFFGGGSAVQRMLAPDTAPGTCPYPGLSAFRQEHAQWFFGRDRVTADLLSLVAQRVREGGLAVVVAPSGAGKSSVLRAGLLAKLDGGLPMAGSQSWPRRIMTPTASPLAALGEQLADLGGEAPWPDDVRDVETLFARCTAYVTAWRAANQDPNARVMLVVDQFEELFTLCPDEPERRVFVALLARLAEPDRDGRTLAAVVLGLRADFYARCADYEPLRLALAANQLLIGPMNRRELREAITEPAAMVGLGLEPGLVEVLLRDLGVTDAESNAEDGYEAGRLPFLAYALEATWQLRQGTVLTVDGYRTTGGIQHAIANKAEHAYNRLDAERQRLARVLLLRLVRIGDDTEDTRRRLTQADLLALGADDGSAAAVLDAFTRERLLSRERDGIEITHEALLRGWPRLRQWIEEDRADALARQNVEEAAAAWDRSGRRDTSLLYRGVRLETAPDTDISPRASVFLAASRRQRRRGRRLRRGVLAAITVLALAASTAAVVAVHNQNQAVQAKNQAVFNELLAEADRFQNSSDVSLAAQLDLIAYRIQPASQQAVTAVVNAEDAPLSRVIARSGASFYGTAFSPDGRTLATTTRNTFQLWNLADTTHISPLSGPMQAEATNVVNQVTFSPDGRTLALAGGDGGVYLWNVADRAHPQAWGGRLAGGAKAVVSVAFSPDGRILADTGEDGTVRLWDVSDPAHPTALGQPLSSTLAGPAGNGDVAFSPVGHTLAAIDRDGALQLWDVSDPAHPAALGRPLQPFNSSFGFQALAFSPDGRRLAAGDAGGSVAVWDTTDPANPVSLTDDVTLLSGNRFISSLTFLPGPYELAVGTRGGDISLWNLTGPLYATPMGPDLLGHTDAVNTLAASPDGRYIASASNDGSVRLWSLPPARQTTGQISSLAISTDGRVLVSAGVVPESNGGILQTWDASHPAGLAPLSQQILTGSQQISALTATHTAQTVATISVDGIAQLWDLRNPARPTRLGPPLPTGGGEGDAVAFSPDGHLLATTTSTTTQSLLQLWNTTDPAHPTAIGQPIALWSKSAGTVSNIVAALVFSPDGRTLAAGGGSDDTIRLWDVTDPTHPAAIGQPLTGHTDAIAALAFSPGGEILASGSYDHTIRLWNLADRNHPAPLGQPLTGHTNALTALAFSPDGNLLASASQDQTVRLWNVANPASPTPSGDPLTGITLFAYPTSLVFSPDGQTLIAGNLDGTLRSWDLRPTTAETWICASTTDITPAQWNQYVSPQLPYDPPCTTGKGL